MGFFDKIFGKKKSDVEIVQEKLKRQAMIDNIVSEKPVFEVQDIHNIKGVGTVVFGKVVSGIIKPTQSTIVNGKVAKVNTIEGIHKKSNEAIKGDRVGIRLENVSINDLKRGDVLEFR